jgi:hypothetical protein
MKHAFCISTVSVSALVLLTSSFIAPLTAAAEERSIAVQPKFKTFKVNDSSGAVVTANGKKRPKIQEFRVDDEANTTDDSQQAEATQPKRPDRPKIQEFRVDDETNTTDDSELAEATPPKRPDRPAVKRFRVEDEDQQAADAIADDQEDVAQLKPEFKPKAPKPQIEQPDISDDEGETDQSTFDNAEDSSDEEVSPPVHVGKKVYQVRYPRRYVSYHSYQPVKRYNYHKRSHYSEPSCNNNYGY